MSNLMNNLSTCESFATLLRRALPDQEVRTKVLQLLQRSTYRDDFEVILTPHIDHLCRLGRRFTGDENNGRDLVVDFLVHLYPRRYGLPRTERLRDWLNWSLYRYFVDTVTGSAEEHCTDLPARQRQLARARLCMTVYE